MRICPDSGVSTTNSHGARCGGRAGTSGASSCRLRWTTAPHGAGTASRAATDATSYDLTRGPKMPIWSVVWLAPVPRSRAGRSAETTTSPTPAWTASRTAGWRLATAVPEVVRTAAREPDLVRPSARKPAVRSSIRVCSRKAPACAAAHSAIANGALREPGATTTSPTPARSSRATRASASTAGVSVMDADPSAPPGPRRAGPPSARPARAPRPGRPAVPRPPSAGRRAARRRPAAAAPRRRRR